MSKTRKARPPLMAVVGVGWLLLGAATWDGSVWLGALSVALGVSWLVFALYRHRELSGGGGDA